MGGSLGTSGTRSREYRSAGPHEGRSLESWASRRQAEEARRRPSGHKPPAHRSYAALLTLGEHACAARSPPCSPTTARSPPMRARSRRSSARGPVRRGRSTAAPGAAEQKVACDREPRPSRLRARRAHYASSHGVAGNQVLRKPACNGAYGRNV